MSSIEEEGRRALMDKLPKDVCPYKGKAAIEWKLGYAKQEYDELQEEQMSLLESMGFYSEPHTGLEEFLTKLQKSIDKYNDLKYEFKS